MSVMKLLIDLCLFQAKPQDLPYSPGWALLTAVLLCTSIVVSYPPSEQASLIVMLVAIVHVVGYGSAIGAALWYRARPERARHLAFAAQGVGLIGLIIVFTGAPSSVRLGISLLLGGGFLLVLTVVFRQLAPLAQATARFVQTATAIFGTAALLQFVTWPFVDWLDKVKNTPDAQLPLLAILAVGAWTFAVAVAVNRQALEMSIGQSILVTLGAQIFAASIVFILFGAIML